MNLDNFCTSEGAQVCSTYFCEVNHEEYKNPQPFQLQQCKTLRFFQTYKLSLLNIVSICRHTPKKLQKRDNSTPMPAAARLENSDLFFFLYLDDSHPQGNCSNENTKKSTHACVDG